MKQETKQELKQIKVLKHKPFNTEEAEIKIKEALNKLSFNMEELNKKAEETKIYIRIDDITQESRIKERGNSDWARIKEIEQHSTESQVSEALLCMADLILDGSRAPEELVADILAWIRN